MKRLILVGSPRAGGRSAHLAETLFEANIDEHPEDELFLVPLSEVEVGPCIACNACREKTPVTFVDDSGEEVTEQKNRCIFDDDMQTLYDLFDDVDEITVVSPIFFSGAPAQLKCLLDRLQPYYWSDARKAPKRPAALHVVGEGGDPHGHDPLVTEVKSAFAVAGFKLERVLDWVGKIDAGGEIVADASETVLGRVSPGPEVRSGDPGDFGDPDSSGGSENPSRQKTRQPRSRSQGGQSQDGGPKRRRGESRNLPPSRTSKQMSNRQSKEPTKKAAGKRPKLDLGSSAKKGGRRG